MAEVIEAVYKNGVLKPLRELNLKEGEKVKIRIVERSYSLSEIIKKISKEYIGVKEDPLKILLEDRR